MFFFFLKLRKNSTPAIFVVSNQNPSCRKSNQSSCLIPNRDRPGPENGQTIPKPEILAPKSKPEDCNKPKRHKVRFSSAPKYRSRNTTQSLDDNRRKSVDFIDPRQQCFFYENLLSMGNMLYQNAGDVEMLTVRWSIDF